MKNALLLNNVEIKQQLGENIRKHRVEAGYSQSDLAKKSGVSVHSISNIENGSDFTIDNLLNILRSLYLIQNIEYLVPELAPNPFDVAKGIDNRRRKSRK